MLGGLTTACARTAELLEQETVGVAGAGVARRIKADAGTRRVDGLRSVRLRGVTTWLLHDSDVPVIVVPPSPKD